MRKRSLEQIYAVLAAPCSTITTPYTNPVAPCATIPTPYTNPAAPYATIPISCTNPAAPSATTAEFRVSVTTFCVTTLTVYATIATVLRKIIKTTKFLS